MRARGRVVPLLGAAALAVLGGCARCGGPSVASDAAMTPLDACIAAESEGARAIALEYERAVAHRCAPPLPRASALHHACAPLFARRACGEAHEHFDDPPIEQRQAILSRTCRDEYCADLGEPRPALCARAQEPGTLAELSLAYAELDARILRHDLGPPAERLLTAREEGRGMIRGALLAYLDAGSPPLCFETPDGAAP